MPAPETYVVGWICAITTEYTAACQFLDERHDPPEYVSLNDNNDYTLGRMGKHHVVIAVLPDGEYGTTSAASVARDMLHSFSNVRIGLMVGIGGGAPSAEHDIRLGDVVVSSPSGRTDAGGVFQYDYGKAVQNREFERTGLLNQPPTLLRTHVSGLRTEHESEGHLFQKTIDRILEQKPRLRSKYKRPDQADRLYKSHVTHPFNSHELCDITCGNDASALLQRSQRTEEDDDPAVHYGLIASANQLMKDAIVRDTLAKTEGVLCFEMEAAGLMNYFPCLVVRGICDYADSHKNKDWQGYAAMTAAAYAKDLLRRIPANRVEAEERISEAMKARLNDITAITRKTANAVESMIDQQRRDQINSWLSPPNPSINYEKGLQHRHPGSGQWFIQSAAYSAWKLEQYSFLWLHGMPGCGKTILSCIIIEDLQRSQVCSEGPFYFFFDFIDDHKQSFEEMLRSLISQLSRRVGHVQSHTDTLYLFFENKDEQKLNTEMLRKIFEDMVCQIGEVWIVLDALDECKMRSELLSWIEYICRPQQTKVHLLVTSRLEHDIESSIGVWAGNEDVIPIRSELITIDLRAFISTRVRRDRGLERWRTQPDIQTEIETTLVREADGMFRWAACQLDALENCLDYSALQNTLRSLPRSLDETYARTLAGIPPEYANQTRRILQFVAFAERPLSLREIVDAIAVDLESQQRFDLNNRVPIPSEILRYCKSLVTVEEKKDPVEDATTTEIRLAHFTVKEYLAQRDISGLFSTINSSAAIARVCLSYLLALNTDIPPDGIRQSFPLAQFSADHWMSYAALAEGSDERLRALILEFFSTQHSYEGWYLLYTGDNLSDKSSEKAEAMASPLYYASLGGLEISVRCLLRNGAQVNATGGYFDSALRAASFKGHEKVVLTLLSNGADMNDSCGSFGNALQAASFGNSEKVVRLLLDKGANVNAASGGHEKSALHVAAERGQLQALEMLLQGNADPSLPDKYGETPLHYAAGRGHIAIAKSLLDHRAPLRKLNNRGMTPLDCARCPSSGPYKGKPVLPMIELLESYSWGGEE